MNAVKNKEKKIDVLKKRNLKKGKARRRES